MDGINYIHPEDLVELFRLLHLFIAPDGLLVFDVNSPERFRSLDGQVFVDETDEVLCLWRADFDYEENALIYGMDLFTRCGDTWQRSFEEHREYAYSAKQLVGYLKDAGFTSIAVYGDRTFSAPAEGEQRIYLKARKGRVK